MELSIIIVNYNTRDLLAECIDSVKKSISQIDYELIVVDNNSTDGSIELLNSRYRDVKLIENKCNVGFARANNQGYGISQGEYILLLNSDTIILKDALNKMKEFLDKNKGAAIVGARLLNPDMTLQLPCRRGFPRFVNSVAYFSGLARMFPNNRVLGSYLMTYKDDRNTHEVDAVSGACLMVRRACVKKNGGLLDEDFFMHFEDIDLCYRSKKMGYKVYYKHDAEVVHLKGQSSKLRSKQVMIEFYSSAVKYYRKNYKAENPIAYLFIVFIIVIMKSLHIAGYRLKSSRGG